MMESKLTMARRIAVVLMVKDEADELLPWIAWYVSLGANTIFVFDDGSTDDTTAIARLAALAFDVRTVALVQDGKPHPERQRECYISVLRDHGSHYDWIGFFDADEYLDLPPGMDLPTFLSRGADVGAIGISWCNYGSSDNVLKPNDHPFNAYTHHFPVQEDIGRHVKTFVQPGSWTGRWFNVHYFEVKEKRYVDPSGQDIVWSGTPGVTRDKATWQGGRLMHYQCRSMEHFIERMRKRPDLPKSTRIWTSYDNNAVHADLPAVRRRQVCVALRTIMVEALRMALSSAGQGAQAASSASPSLPPPPRGWFERLRRPLPAQIQPPEPASVPSFPNIRFWRVLSDEGFAFRFAADTAEIIADLPVTSEGHADECLLLSIETLPATVFLFAPGAHEPLQIGGEVRVTPLLRFTMGTHNERVTLRNPASHRFLSVSPRLHGARPVCDRYTASDWEMFRLEPLGEQHAVLARQMLGFDLLRPAFADPAVLNRGEAQDAPLLLAPLLLALAAPPLRDALRGALGTAVRYFT